MSASTGILRQRAVDGGHGGHRRDLVVLDDLPEPGVQGRVAVARRARPHHPGAAEHRRDAGDDQRVDVEQRQPAQHPLPGRQPAAHRRCRGRRRAGWRGCARRSSGRRWSRRCARTRPDRPPPGGSAGQAAGWLPGDHLVQVGHGQRAAVRRTAGRGVTVQGGRGAVRAVGPQRQDGGHPRLAGYPEQPLPQLRVQLRPGRDQDARSGPADQLGDPLRGQRGVDRGGDPGGLRGQGRRVQHRGVHAGQRDRVAAAHPQSGQRVGDAGHRAGQLGVGPGQAAGEIGRVGDPLGGDAVGPGAGGVQQQLVGRLRLRQYFSCGHGSFPIMVLRCVPRSSRPSGEAIVAVMTSPSRR